MSWRYGQTELESWLGTHLSRAQLRRLKTRGNIFSASGIGGIRSKGDMDILLDLVAEQSGASKSKLRRLRWEARSSSTAKKYLLAGERSAGSRELYRSPSAIDVKRDRVQELRERAGQEHYLLKYKKGTPKERARLESKRISELAKEGQAWRDIEYNEDDERSPMERAQHRAALNKVTQRRTRLDS